MMGRIEPLATGHATTSGRGVVDIARNPPRKRLRTSIFREFFIYSDVSSTKVAEGAIRGSLRSLCRAYHCCY